MLDFDHVLVVLECLYVSDESVYIFAAGTESFAEEDALVDPEAHRSAYAHTILKSFFTRIAAAATDGTEAKQLEPREDDCKRLVNCSILSLSAIALTVLSSRRNRAEKKARQGSLRERMGSEITIA